MDPAESSTPAPAGGPEGVAAPQGERITVEAARSIAAAGGTIVADQIVCVAQGGEVGEVDKAARRVFHWASSGQVDRYRDRITQEGIETKSYDSNPVWLMAHGYYGLPIGTSVEHGLRNSRLFSIVEFWRADDLPHGQLCETIFRLTTEKVMRACSVGLGLLEYSYDRERGGLNILHSDLREISKVAVPANPSALCRGASAAGVSLEPLVRFAFELIEEGERGGVVVEGAPLLVQRDVAEELARLTGFGSALEIVQVDGARLADLRKRTVATKGEGGAPPASGPVVAQLDVSGLAPFVDRLERAVAEMSKLAGAPIGEGATGGDGGAPAATPPPSPSVDDMLRYFGSPEGGELFKDELKRELDRVEVGRTGKLPERVGEKDR